MVSYPEIINRIKKNNKHRIGTIEQIIGNGDSAEGAKQIKEFLCWSIKLGLSPATIGKALNKERHVIHKWCKRYNLQYSNVKGDKRSLLRISSQREESVIDLPREERIDGDVYKVFYLYPDTVFTYLIGVILGDGNVDSRKIYITGGNPHKSLYFLDNLYRKIEELCKPMGITTKIKYYDRLDKEIARNNSKLSYWRLYIYWAALSHSLKSKIILKEILERIWSVPEMFNSFTAGLLDTDGYFVSRQNKPERIELGQTIGKWWFTLFLNKLKEVFPIKCIARTRKYEIKNRGRIYKGISKSITASWYMSSWSKLIDEIILPFCLNPDRLGKAAIFKQHALKMENRFRIRQSVIA